MTRALPLLAVLAVLTACGSANHHTTPKIIYPAAIHAPRVARACEQTRTELRKIADTILFGGSAAQEEKRFEKEGPPNEQPRYDATVTRGLAVLKKAITAMQHMTLAHGEQPATKIVLPRLKEHRRGLETVRRELEAHPVIKGAYAETWYPRIGEVMRGCNGSPGSPPFPGAA